jgi:hypothetical protein
MIDAPLHTAIERAARRTPSPAALNSLAQIPNISVDDVPLPEPARRPGPLRIAPGELWCARCYESFTQWAGRRGDEKSACPRCGGRKSIEAVAVLRPDEYNIAN